MSNPASLVGPRRDNASRGELAVHDHVCGIYDARQEQYEPACKFLKVGLEQNQQCLYIAETLTPAEFMALLETHGVHVREATETGSLLVLSGKEVRATLGGFTPEAMFTFLKQAERKALLAGFSAFRWAADMMWLRKDDIEPVDMFTFEAGLNRLLQQHQLVAFCQYARDDFKSELLIAAAETHPLLVYNQTVCDNFYYIPPEEYLKPTLPDVKLKRILFNIVSRERLMQSFLAD